MSEKPTSDIAAGLPPVQGKSHSTEEMPSILVREPTATEVFVAWEKLRLLYNVTLVLVVIYRIMFHDLDLFFLIEGALVANLAFCAGPVAEGYACWLGFPRLVRWLIFIGGMIVASGLAFVTPVPQRR